MSNNIGNSRRAGFTLVEVMVAVFIASVGIAAGHTLINQTLSAMGVASDGFVAAYLGKEGIEIVKNIRDSNYLKLHRTSGNWDDGLCVGEIGGCRADYTMGSLLNANVSSFLLRDSNGFYNYTQGDPSPYSRVITVTSPQVNVLNVSVRVDWSERGRTHSLTVQENLHNWWP